jgi:hypothetical protein
MRACLLCVPLLFITSLAFAQPAGTLAFPSTPPPEVASARRLHAPPRVVVEVQTVDAPPKGGDGPCKDPVCLALVLSVMAIEKAFPKQYDRVTVRVDGESRFHGTYEVGGRFLYGYLYSPEGTRRFERLELRHLEKTLIVETEQRRPQLPVEELLADYQRALAATKSSEKRAGLLSEALQLLGEPALPLVRERLADPAEADEVKASALATGCGARDNATRDGQPLWKLFEVALGTKPPPGPETLAVTVSCRLEHKQLVSRGLLEVLVASLCRAETLPLEGRAYALLSRLKQEGTPELDPRPLFESACEQPARRAVLRTCLGSGATREEYAAAFTEKDAQGRLREETGKAVLQCLQKERPEHRVGFAEAFRAAPYQRLEWVEHRADPLEAWELEALARDFHTPVKPYGKRAWVLDRFAGAASEPERTAPARAVLLEWVRKTEQERQVALAKEGDVMRFLRGVQGRVVGPGSNDITVTAGIALMVLGEVEETPRAALGLRREPHPVARTSVENELDLAAYAFTRVGCTRAEMQAASALLHANKPMPRGPWCASQKRGR